MILQYCKKCNMMTNHSTIRMRVKDNTEILAKCLRCKEKKKC